MRLNPIFFLPLKFGFFINFFMRKKLNSSKSVSAIVAGICSLGATAATAQDATELDPVLAVSYTHLRAHETLRYLVCRGRGGKK